MSRKVRRWDKHCLRAGCTLAECDCAHGASATEVAQHHEAQILARDGTPMQRRAKEIERAVSEGRDGDALALSLDYESGGPSPR